MVVLLIAGFALLAVAWTSLIHHFSVFRYRMTRFTDLHSPLGDTDYWRIKISSKWANEEWTGDDKPYQSIEREVDSSLATYRSVPDLLENASEIAQQKPTDPLAQFRWSYLARQVVLAPPYRVDWISDSEEVISVLLDRAVSPKTYSYDRLRFLEQSQNPFLTNLGERLLRRNPNDVAVKERLCGDYSGLFSLISQKTHQVDPKLKQRAIALAQQLIASQPLNAKYHGDLASVYVSSWDDHRNPEDAADAIAAYEDCLRLAPNSDFSKYQLSSILKGLRTYLSDRPLQRHHR